MKVTFTTEINGSWDAQIVGAYEGKVLTSTAAAMDKDLDGLLTVAMNSSHFLGKAKENVSILTPKGRVIVLGLGKKENDDIEALGGALIPVLSRTPVKNILVNIPEIDGPRFAHGLRLRRWDFEKYHTLKKIHEKNHLESASIVVGNVANAECEFAPLTAEAEGVFLTRTVVAEPANVIYPETMAAEARKLESLGLKVEVLGEKEMAKLGMNALLGVGQGSIRESQLVVISWNGGSKETAPVAIVGKGVTFDTGGISIKPSANMEDMKWDMGGSGVVLGLMKTLALRKASVNVVGVMGLVENMPSGSAQRPGDVVTSMAGKTIEVINTDAEGRLVLADALWYTQDRFKPQAIVDLATLTGAIIVSLGHDYAGLFTNNEELGSKLLVSSKATKEGLWNLPLTDGYESHIKSAIADIKNVGKGGCAGSISAAKFLQHFVNDVPWAHLDIAGVAWSSDDQALWGKGATGFGVRLLNHFLQSNYESK